MHPLKPLPREYEDTLIRKAKDGCLDSVGLLRKQYDQLICEKTRHMKAPNYTPEDIKQELEIAFLEAIRDFDFSRGTRFITALYLRLDYAYNNLLTKLKRHKRAIVFENVMSLSQPASTANGVDDFETVKLDSLEDMSASIAFADMLEHMNKPNISPTEARIVELTVLDEFKPAEVAEIMNITTARVMYLKKRALHIYRKHFESQRMIESSP